MQKLEVRYVPLSSLVPYARNARTHNAAQIEKLKRSLIENDWTNPMLVAGGDLIAGHGRLMAALALRDGSGWTPRHGDSTTGPVIDLSHLPPEKRRAYILADNRLALDAGWDEELLKVELIELRAFGFDLEPIGFDPLEITKLIGGSGEKGEEPDSVPPPAPGQPVSVLGDLWTLGNHRLIVGDSTDGAVVARLLGGEKPHLMVTDPPYGVEYDPAWRTTSLKDKRNRAEAEIPNDNKADWRMAWAHFHGDVAYVWHADRQAGAVWESLQAAGFEIRAQIVWAKNRHAIGRGHYHFQHEPCFYAVRKGGTGHWQGSRGQTTLWSIDMPPKSETGHATQKPVECMQRPIENNSRPGELVYEPFSGSGTTILAAEISGRVARAVELNPLFADMAVRRWQAFTGQPAILAENGHSFDELAQTRKAD